MGHKAQTGNVAGDATCPGFGSFHRFSIGVSSLLHTEIVFYFFIAAYKWVLTAFLRVVLNQPLLKAVS